MNTQKKIQYKGQVIKYKLVQAQDPSLVVFKLKLIDHPLNPTDLVHQDINCLITYRALSFILRVHIGDIIVIYGHYNQRKQFIVQRYLVEQTALTPQDRSQAYPKRRTYD